MESHLKYEKCDRPLIDQGRKLWKPSMAISFLGACVNLSFAFPLFCFFFFVLTYFTVKTKEKVKREPKKKVAILGFHRLLLRKVLTC